MERSTWEQKSNNAVHAGNYSPKTVQGKGMNYCMLIQKKNVIFAIENFLTQFNCKATEELTNHTVSPKSFHVIYV